MWGQMTITPLHRRERRGVAATADARRGGGTDRDRAAPAEDGGRDAALQATTLSFHNMHQHGELLVNLLRARRTSFILRNRWHLPEAEGMEFDQYDTPASRWIAVHDGGRVLAGVRLTPTTARVGMYSYMIRDAQRGRIASIPPDLMDEEAPVDPRTWEASRIFVARQVPARLRHQVQGALIYEMIRAARALGAHRIIAFGPAVWPRWIGRLGLTARPAGPVMELDGVKVQVAVMDLDPRLH